jgi:hypothetical protein
VIATTAGGHQSAELIVEATLATLVVFWLAHVYADFLGHGLRHARSDLRLLASIMVQELSMLVARALSILFLLLGALGCWRGSRGRPGAVERRRPAGRLGIDVGRRRGQAWPAALLTGLVNGAFGVVIGLLEVQLHWGLRTQGRCGSGGGVEADPSLVG